MGVSLVLALVDAAGVDRRLVGGKAGTLGVLAAAGFPVPPGFVVTAVAAAGSAGEVAAAAATAVVVEPGRSRYGPPPRPRTCRVRRTPGCTRPTSASTDPG